MGVRQTLTGFGIGLGLMYYFDPDLGRRRRALARDKLTRALNDLDDATEITLRDARNRFQGFLSETLSLLPGPQIPDERLEGRIRSVLGHRVAQSRKVDISVHNGTVVLSGSVHPADTKRLLSAIRLVRGVRHVENRLEAGDESSPQLAPAQASWPPTTRLTAGVLGTWLMTRCASRPTLTNTILGTLGFGMFTRAITNVAVMETAEAGVQRIKEFVERSEHPAETAETVGAGAGRS